MTGGQCLEIDQGPGVERSLGGQFICTPPAARGGKQITEIW